MCVGQLTFPTIGPGVLRVPKKHPVFQAGEELLQLMEVTAVSR